MFATTAMVNKIIRNTSHVYTKKYSNIIVEYEMKKVISNLEKLKWSINNNYSRSKMYVIRLENRTTSSLFKKGDSFYLCPFIYNKVNVKRQRLT